MKWRSVDAWLRSADARMQRPGTGSLAALHAAPKSGWFGDIRAGGPSDEISGGVLNAVIMDDVDNNSENFAIKGEAKVDLEAAGGAVTVSGSAKGGKEDKQKNEKKKASISRVLAVGLSGSRSWPQQ
jgi:hypothetical protein